MEKAVYRLNITLLLWIIILKLIFNNYNIILEKHSINNLGLKPLRPEISLVCLCFKEEVIEILKKEISTIVNELVKYLDIFRTKI